ncbi:hypothetical protein FCH28_15855 [Streptomyces piniterrae]|uniref:Uncharacterized protein n=1 Tax=Streptomyces piniterrae TaxID=2571125 RepID=A0A4V6WHP5_9ACTN|nr:DUF6406 domain-containing protein [Streptomyces piniterrae]TJZ54568.1 hypothetical protein FCH28_15855 [Streptomyces piniterrae]
MSVDTIKLWHGIQRKSDNARFAVIDVYTESDASVRVRLGSVATEEQRHTLRIGENFPVGEETWQLADVKGWPGEDWIVELRRVAAAPA